MNNPEQDEDLRLKSLSAIHKEAWAFQHSLDFLDPNKPNSFRKDLTVEKIMNRAGLKKVGFQDLPVDLQEGIKKKLKGWWGYPLDRNSLEQLPDSQIFTNANEDTIYCVIKDKSGQYSWSRIERMSDTYRVEELNHDSSMEEVIQNVGYFELQYRQNSILFPGNKNPRITMPANPKNKLAENIRGDIAGLTK